MSAYAIGNLFPPARLDDEVLTYMERIQSTLDPYGGRFLVHGAAERHVVEGEWPGSLVVIAFPTMRAARDWYASADYQALLPLRTRHMSGDALLVDGVPEGYDAAATAAQLRGAQAAG
ncbi:DUF1330 domain-containing protein [Streptomyces pacificus]|uniref:DUF1330 domain-containing protein n=1 Tax=Streptomyces pacificus TaxID=2705029 RepID=A0A6A0AUA4_9ACTN|nr:DUF1330 domain-containing protein [Streptomyces pacificus]GFH35943.1 DUF1330 domain-containing protein [Streptomyces pacificus]